MTATTTYFSAVFAECRNFQDANSLFRELFLQHGADQDMQTCVEIQEAHRRCMERLTHDARELTAAQPDGDGLRNREVRNWAMKHGVPLAKKGRVSRETKDAYRIAHDMPVVDSKPLNNIVGEVTASPAEIRLWARSAGIEVGSRGRVHPDIVRQYAEAHS